MDAIEFSYQRDVSISKNLMGKGFGRERMLCGERRDHSEPISVVSVPGSSVLTGCNTSGSIKDKARAVKQNHGLDGKRSDRKKFKPHMKSKLDSFFSKNGITSSNSSSGGNNILGIYGLKSDIHAVTRHVDELSLNELLDGSYKCPILSQSKGRKSSTTDNILHSVRKVCSILQPQRTPEQSQKDVDLDSGSIKMEACLSDTGFCSSTREENDIEDKDLHGKTSSCKIEDSHKKCLDARLLHQPNVILERLSFQPVKDLDSLLFDTANPGVSSRVSPDIRTAKGTSQKYRLSPFYWSHSFTGSCKTNIDGSKLTIRSSACQSRWVRIGSTTHADNTGCFSDLDSFACDYNLISLKQLNLGLSEKVPTSASTSFPWTGQVLLSTSEYPPALGFPHKSENCLGTQLKFGFNMSIVHDDRKLDNSYARENYSRFEENKDNGGGEPSKRKKSACSTEDGSCYSLFKSSVTGYPDISSHLHDPDNTKHDVHSPRLLAAAQTLHEISRLSRTQNQNREKIRWSEKPSKKAMKARKSGSPLGRPEEIPVTPKSVTAHVDDDVINHDRRAVPSKKPRFLMTNNQIKDNSQPSNNGRGSMVFSPPATTSIRSSKLGKGLIPESKKLNSDDLKVLGTMPPSSTRVLDKSCNHSQQKLRKPLFIDWSRGRSKRG